MGKVLRKESAGWAGCSPRQFSSCRAAVLMRAACVRESVNKGGVCESEQWGLPNLITQKQLN